MVSFVFTDVSSCRKIENKPTIGSIALTNGFAGNLRRAVLFDVSCTGRESSILECARSTSEQESCGELEDAYVQCQGMCP